MSFRVETPSGPEIPVVVEIPHAGLRIDAESLGTLVAPAHCIGRDADLLVDELYADAAELGASVLIAELSRYVCDLNRAETDVDAGCVAGTVKGNAPHGLIWRQTTEGHPAIEGPISQAEFERRLASFYRPYHAALQRLLDQKKARFGRVILLCAHSMPSAGRAGHPDTGAHRADVVPGSRARSTAAAEIIDCPDALARKRGWSVAHDVPYRGGFSTAHYGQPAQGVHAVQVELNRQLYMDEMSLTRLPAGFIKTREYCTELVTELGRIGNALRV